MMKILYILSVFLGGMIYSSKGQEVVIAGHVSPEGSKQILLYQVRDGGLCYYDSTEVNGNGKFELKTEIDKEGFYTIGGNQKQQFSIYLKPGDKVNIEITDWQARLSGKNSPENRWLYDWENAVAEVRSESFFYDKVPVAGRMIYSDFFPLLEKVADEMQIFLTRSSIGNEKFNRLMRSKIRYDMDFYALCYLKAHRLYSFEMSDLSPYYQTIVSEDKYRECDVLELPWGRQILIEYINFALRNDPSGDFSDEKAFSYLEKDCLKGEYVLHKAEKYKSYDEYVRMLDKYKDWFTLPSQKVRLESIQERLAFSKSGISAPDFACNDRNGKRIALSDFLGKVVVLDVWATWCEPCRKQMPYMIKLEKEYHGKEVVFITMCIGAAVEQASWLELLEKDKLEGLHVFMPGWNSQFAKDYKVSGVPRFMVFDKKGNIVSIRAPRPSTPELKKMIDIELQK